MQDHIKITNTPPRVQYIGDGVQREFFYPFPIFKPEDIAVYIGEARLTGGMTVDGAGDSTGGSVLLDEAPGAGVLITVCRHLAIERTTDFQPGGAFSARLINDEFDYLTAALQQLAADTEASLRRAPTEPVVEMTLPAATARANRILAFDGDGRPVAESKDAIAATIRHGAVRDLGDDDHPQYLTDYRADVWLAQHSLDDLREGITVKRFTGVEKTKLASLPANAEANPPRVSEEEKIEAQVTAPRTFSPRDIAEVAARIGGSSGGSGNESVHSALLGLQADDHLQYLTTERADAWLATRTADDLADGSVNRYMTFGGNGAADVAARADHAHPGIYEPSFAKNTAFNRNFGTAAGEVAAGNHSHDAIAISTGIVDVARLPVVGGDTGSGGTAGWPPLRLRVTQRRVSSSPPTGRGGPRQRQAASAAAKSFRRHHERATPSTGLISRRFSSSTACAESGSASSKATAPG